MNQPLIDVDKQEEITSHFKIELFLIYTWMARDETAASAAVGNDSTSWRRRLKNGFNTLVHANVSHRSLIC